jgi:hypothetical protein
MMTSKHDLTADNAGVRRPLREPDELTARQRKALKAARDAEDRFEEAQADYRRASDERTAVLDAALATGITYGELANALGWSLSRVQAAVGGRERNG